MSSSSSPWIDDEGRSLCLDLDRLVDFTVGVAVLLADGVAVAFAPRRAGVADGLYGVPAATEAVISPISKSAVDCRVVLRFLVENDKAGSNSPSKEPSPLLSAVDALVPVRALGVAVVRFFRPPVAGVAGN